MNPKLSAYALLHGQFNYMKTPIAPPGIRVQAHEKPSNRASFATHSSGGWYIGPAKMHYRCYQIYMPKTGATQIFDVVEFFPHRFKMPATSSIDKANQCILDLIELLKSPAPASPFPQFGDKKLQAIEDLANIFRKALPKTPSNTPTVVPRVGSQNVPRVPSAQPTQAPTPIPPQNNVVPQPPEPSYTGTRFDVGPRRHWYNTRLQATLQHSSMQAYSVAPILFHWANPVIDPETGKSLEYRHLINDPKTRDTWLKAMANEIGRLAQGVGGRIEGTDTFEFVHWKTIPKHKVVTYARIVSEIRPQKPDPHRIRMTAGGNLIIYPGDKSQPTADLLTAKILFNSVISTPHAKFMTIEIKNMYLMSNMTDCEYMRIPVELIPPEIMTEYKLENMVHNGYVYCKIKKGMYGLPQAGKLAHDKLKAHLAKYGYSPCRLTPGLWKHESRPISFSLVVDDFGVKYTNKDDVDHLIQALRDCYELHIDWSGSLYIGITLNWNYDNRTVQLSMPNYVQKALHKFQHKQPAYPQHSPHEWTRPVYGAAIQYAPVPDAQPFLSTKETNIIQQIVGTFLYYAHAVDPTMLMALNKIGANQAAPTATTARKVTQFLDFAATYPNATITYTASDMVLHVHSDASYLSAPNARSRVSGHYYLSSKPVDPTKPPVNPPHNGPLHTECKTMRNVMASAAEAELGGLFHNGQTAIPIRQALKELGHPQPATPIQTDNSTACGIVNSSICQRKSKSMDMRFYWVQDRVNQGHFLIYWATGKMNLADYFTKHHPVSHHKTMRPDFVQEASSVFQQQPVQGCVRPSVSRTSARIPTRPRLPKTHIWSNNSWLQQSH